MSDVRRGLLTVTAFGMLLGWHTAALRAQMAVSPNFRLPNQMAPQAPVVAPSAIQSGASSPYLNPVLPGLSGTGTLSTPYLGGAGTGTLSNPGSTTPYNPYYNPYLPYVDPLSGFLQGAAAVTTANAQYYATIQSARVTQQQANQAAIDTRRRLFDQIRYERMSIPSPEEVRVREMEVALNRSRRNPPLAEIWSGEALNSLYNNLANLQGKGNKGPRVDLDEDMLKHINVTTGTAGNMGILKDGGKLQWPAPLQRPEFGDARKVLNELLPEAIQQVKFNNPLPGGVAKDIQAALSSLEDMLNKDINELPPSQSIEAFRYLNCLKEGVRALQGEKASDYLNGKYSAKGKTVAELVKYMSDNGLKFAAASPGDEGAYRALHFAMASYDDGISQVAAGR